MTYPDAADTARRKIVIEGLHRVRHAEDTWELVSRDLPRYGITRVADVTGLDILGIPVAMAVRPLAKTLSVSQGKGRSLLLAKISAVMECVELWHAEHVRSPLVHRDLPAMELDLPYAVDGLATEPGSLINNQTRFDWIRATGLLSRQETVVPTGAVHLHSPHETKWQPFGMLQSSSGLASGNIREEATVHGMYELIERDAVSRQRQSYPPSVLDLDSIDDSHLCEIVAKVLSAGALLSVARISNRFQLPCFLASIWSEDFPVTCVGFGAHMEAGAAFVGAVTEAAQSRLTGITGSRDDAPAVYTRIQDGLTSQPSTARPSTTWRECAAMSLPSFTDVADDEAHLAAIMKAVIGSEPLVVDLSTTASFSVIKVLVPDLALDSNVIHPSV